MPVKIAASKATAALRFTREVCIAGVGVRDAQRHPARAVASFTKSRPGLRSGGARRSSSAFFEPWAPPATSRRGPAPRLGHPADELQAVGVDAPPRDRVA